MTLAELIPGDWIELNIGFSRIEVYVIENEIETAKLTFCSPYWLYTSPWTWTYDEIIKCGSVYLGRGKWKWWVFWEPKLIVPYTRPKKRLELALRSKSVSEYMPGGWRSVS